MKNNQLAVGKTSEMQLVSVKKIQDIILQNSIWLFLVICLISFSFSSEYFLTVTNLTNVLVQGSFIGLLAIGMTLCMINGNIDLTVGAVLGLAASLAVGLQADFGIVVSILAALAAGLLLGLLNGTVTVFSGVNSFIHCHHGGDDRYKRPCLCLYR